MMNVALVNAAIVVLSDGNNPGILNPDFLERNDIIPKAWKAENVLVTPPFAQVSYADGLQINVEENKLQFACSQPESFNWQIELPRIAVAYLSVLPHVSYRAVGLNFTFKNEDLTGDEAERRLISELLRQGPWMSARGGITGTAIELQYRSSQPHMNVKMGLAEVPSGGNGKKKLSVLGLSVNFHHDFLPDQQEERVAFIHAMKTRHDESIDFFKTLPL